MRRLGMGIGLAVLGLALGAATGRAADDDSDKKAAPRWWNSVWPRAADKTEHEDKPAKTEAVKAGPSSRDKAIAQREKEKAAYLRREAACNRLMQIAQETDDLELHRRADELNERAWRLYMERTATLPSIPGVATEPAPLVKGELELPKQALRKEKP